MAAFLRFGDCDNALLTATLDNSDEEGEVENAVRVASYCGDSKCDPRAGLPEVTEGKRRRQSSYAQPP